MQDQNIYIFALFTGHPDTTEESITAYSIYVDGQWHGEVKASRMGDQQGYQFFLTDLAPEQSYDVSVKVRFFRVHKCNVICEIVI